MLQLEELTWPELEALDRAHSVVFVPLSPIEEHGPHLPLGTDMYTCRAITKAIATQLEQQQPEVTAILAPLLPLGAGTIPYLGTVGVPPRLVRDALVRVGRAFARDGFRFIIAVSGHLGMSHLLAMEMAARVVSRRYGVMMVAPVASIWRSVLHNEELVASCACLEQPITRQALTGLLRSHHAGALETSLMLYLHPELVRPDFQQLRRVDIGQFVRWRGWTREHWPGYFGEPALARADLGRLLLETIGGLGADLAAQMVLGKELKLHSLSPLHRLVARPRLGLSLFLGGAGVLSGLVGWRFWERRRQKSV